MERDKDLERRFAKSLAVFREARRRDPRLRPFYVELFGLPKSYKTTTANTIQHFLNREKWKISAPPEGPEIIETPYGRLPLYNYRTFWYSMCQMFDRSESLFEAVVLERAIFDHVTWLEYWARKGEMTKSEQKVCEAYALQPRLRQQFDLHLCFVTDPEVALQREVSTTVSKREGETMNPSTMRNLLEIHKKTWERFDGEGDPRMQWIDTTTLTLPETAFIVLEHVCAAFERRLKSL